MLWLVLVLLLAACSQEETTSEVDFAVLGGLKDDGTLDYTTPLMKRVRDEKWIIGYNTTNNCSSYDLKKFASGDEFTKWVEKATRAWLSALTEAGKTGIVNKIEFEHTPYSSTYPDRYAFVATHACRKDNSMRSLGAVGYAVVGGRYIVATQDKYTGRYVYPGYSTYLHEIGHLLGLGDTYVYNYEEMHGVSIMSSHGKELARDDKVGIVWLYEHYFEGKKTSCPEFYKQGYGGCIPEDDEQNAAIVDAKLGAFTLQKMLYYMYHYPDSLKTVDKHGNTTIHYLALRKARHGDKMYDAVVEVLNGSGDISCEDLISPFDSDALDGGRYNLYQSRLCWSRNKLVEKLREYRAGKFDLEIKNKDGLTAADLAHPSVTPTADDNKTSGSPDEVTDNKANPSASLSDIDFNEDKKVNILDLVLLSNCVNKSQQCQIPDQKADINQDGKVDQEDMGIVASLFGCPAN